MAALGQEQRIAEAAAQMVVQHTAVAHTVAAHTAAVVAHTAAVAAHTAAAVAHTAAAVALTAVAVARTAAAGAHTAAVAARTAVAGEALQPEAAGVELHTAAGEDVDVLAPEPGARKALSLRQRKMGIHYRKVQLLFHTWGRSR